MAGLKNSILRSYATSDIKDIQTDIWFPNVGDLVVVNYRFVGSLAIIVREIKPGRYIALHTVCGLTTIYGSEISENITQGIRE